MGEENNKYSYSPNMNNKKINDSRGIHLCCENSTEIVQKFNSRKQGNRSGVD